MINHAFTTPILRSPSGLAPDQLNVLRDYLLDLQGADAGRSRSNRGGWHSSGNLFAPEFRQFDFLRDAVMRGLLSYVADVFGHRGDVRFSLTAWTVINRSGGDFNVPHNHAANLLSGALYVDVPQGMQGGELVFQDPRLNLNAHEVPDMPIKAPWMANTLSVMPAAGEMLVFPAWLMHYVQPMRCADPQAARIVVSFNATLA